MEKGHRIGTRQDRSTVTRSRSHTFNNVGDTIVEMIWEHLSSLIKNIDYAIVHMNQTQWAIVAFVAVAIGFLALRSQKICL